MKRILFLLLLAGVIGCAPKRNATKSVIVSPKEVVSIEIESEGNSIRFEVHNNSDSSILLYSYNLLYIERSINGVWERISILACPCGVPCAKPTEFFEIPKGQSYKYTWDKTESWCTNQSNSPVPVMHSVAVEKGRYRIMVVYSGLLEEQKIIYKEFDL